MIGVVTRYRQQDFTLAALSIISYLERTARAYMLVTYDWRAKRVDAAYDHCQHQKTYRKWLNGINHIIWTAPVDPYFIETARRQGISSTLYTSWDNLGPADKEVLHDYAHVVIPTIGQAAQIRDFFHLQNVAFLPYDCGAPYTVKAKRRANQPIRLFMSLYGSQLHRVDLSSLFLLEDFVKKYPHVSVTIACDHGLASYTRKELKRIQDKHLGRYTVLWDTPWCEHVMQMGIHDLTIWPAKWDGYGIIANSSLTMGTPVVGWDISPVNEHLQAGKNSLLISTDVEHNWLNMPKVKPNYAELTKTIDWAINKPDVLDELQNNTLEQVVKDKKEWNEGWSALLPREI